ncbi:hypothetical protein ACHAWF_003147 [Thalassiosira exigua]
MNAIRVAAGGRNFARGVGAMARQCGKPRTVEAPARLVTKSPIAVRANSGSSPSAPQPPKTDAAAASSLKNAKTTAGTGDPEGLGANAVVSTRGPVTWPALGLVAVTAASAVAYYKIERERRLENAMGKIVSSESGWSPNPELLARRQYVRTKWGWFPKEDAFGGGELFNSLSLGNSLFKPRTSWIPFHGMFVNDR